MIVAHFDKVIAEIRRALAKSTGLEPNDKRAIEASLAAFLRLEDEYHGSPDDDEGEA